MKVKLTHKDYSDLIASTRETVTAALNRLKNESIIDFKEKYIIIRSLDKVEDLAAA